MKKLIFVAFCCTTLAQGQTLDQAQKMLQGGDYPKAENALKRLASRRNAEANRLLGELYLKQYRFDEATNQFSTFKSLSEKAKKSVSEYEPKMKQAAIGAQMMLGIEDVAIIDSVVTDKHSFLESYTLGNDAGKLFRHNDFFSQQGESPGTVYQTELGTNILFGQNGKIYSSTRQFNTWSPSAELPAVVNSAQSNDYPFLCSDGITLYFSSTGHDAFGGYDIFVTRANGSDYLQPENVGMPFNSPYNDYMMAIDEQNNLGWFVSDRYQPEGKVCVYIFIPNENKKTYDIDAYEESQLIRLAGITSLKESWKGREQRVKEALIRLENVRVQSNQEQKKEKADFQLIINDTYTYTQWSDFKSSAARQKATTWLENEQKAIALKQALLEARIHYSVASNAQKEKMKLSILDLEKRSRELKTQNEQLLIEIQNTEIKQLTK